LDSDPLLGVGVALGMVMLGTSHTTHASTSTIVAVANVPKDSNEFEDSEPDIVVHVKDPISSSGDEFDD
jgi:hypothetical protein